jgi:large subunit ribosomal protein L4
MNKKERKLALATALQSAAGDMIVCEDFSALEAVSTKGLLANLAAMGVQEVRRLLLLLLECFGGCW